MSSNGVENSSLGATLFACLILLSTGCLAADARRAARPSELPAAKSEARPRVVVLADSLATSAGKSSYPYVLQRRIDEAGYGYEVVNAGRGGDTTAGGLRRLDQALEGNVAFLVIELGGNDGFRGVPVDTVKRNLTAIVERAQRRGITVLLVQMETPPTRGWDYAVAFHKLFGEIASERKITLIPFVLAEVYGRKEYTTDGVHPNAAGARVIADVVWGSLRPLLEEASRRRASGRSTGS